MIIEITGPSGAGKSTFVKELLQQFDQSNIQYTGVIEGLIDNQYHLPESLTNVLKHNRVTDFSLLFSFSRFAVSNLKLVTNLLIEILNLTEHRHIKIAIFRSLYRKMAIFQFFNKRRFRQKVIIIDEGITHILHNLFAHTDRDVDELKLVRIMQALPSADITVCLFQDYATLVQRLRKRTDKSPRVTDDKSANHFLKNAKVIYEKVLKHYNGAPNFMALTDSTDSRAALDEILIKCNEAQIEHKTS